MQSTKARILEVALDLFASKGYAAVSIRDICKQVEIKESSVYYHFKNKQAIFDELIQQFENVAVNLMKQLETAITAQEHFSENLYSTVCDYFFEKYLMNDFCNKVIRLMLIEQFNNETVKLIYQKWLFDEPLKFQSGIFEVLTKIGLIKKSDSEYIAVKYYAPIFFFAQKWLFSGELSKEKKEAFRAEAYEHIQLFFAEIGGI